MWVIDLGILCPSFVFTQFVKDTLNKKKKQRSVYMDTVGYSDKHGT